jgi:hypothetical protein
MEVTRSQAMIACLPSSYEIAMLLCLLLTLCWPLSSKVVVVEVFYLYAPMTKNASLHAGHGYGPVAGTEAYYVWADAGAANVYSGPISWNWTSPTSVQLYTAAINSISSSVSLSCNPYNDPQTSTGWRARCMLPCIQYGLWDEPYFNAATLPVSSFSVSLCPCQQYQKYGLTRDYSSSVMSRCVAAQVIIASINRCT